MFMLKRLTDPALKRLYKFVLKRLIGHFLLDELNLDQLNVQLRSGKIELHNLALNISVLNSYLVGLPFRVREGTIDVVKASIAYSNILTESCSVQIEGIRMIVVPQGEFQDNVANSTSHATDTNGSSHQSVPSSPTNSTSLLMDDASMEGLNFVASWIEEISNRVKVTLTNARIELESTRPTADHFTTSPTILFMLAWAEFADETPVDHESLVTMSAESLGQSKTFGVSHKGIKFHGLDVKIGQECSVFMHDISKTCYLQCKIAPNQLHTIPAFEMDLFVPALRVTLNPQQLAVVSYIYAAFFTNFDQEVMHDTRPVFQSVLLGHSEQWLGTSHDVPAGDPVGDLSIHEFHRIESILKQYRDTQRQLQGRATAKAIGKRSSPLRKASFSNIDNIEVSNLSDVESEESCTSDSNSSADFHDCQSVSTSNVHLQSNIKSNNERAPIEKTVKLHLLDIVLTFQYHNTGTDQESKENISIMCSENLISMSTLNENQSVQGSIAFGRLEIKESHKFFGVVRTTTILSFINVHDICQNDRVYTQYEENKNATQMQIVLKIDSIAKEQQVNVLLQPMMIELDIALINRIQQWLDLFQDQASRLLFNPHDQKVNEKISQGLNTTNISSCLWLQLVLRFPLVTSDEVRFGPSSTRGLCQDKLLVDFYNIKVEQVLILASDTKSLHISGSFKTLEAQMAFPLNGDQHSESYVFEKVLSAASCFQNPKANCFQFLVQSPGSTEILNAKDCNPGDDSFIRPKSTRLYSTNDEDGNSNSNLMNMEEELLISANVVDSTTKASTYVIKLDFPGVNIQVKKNVLDRLLLLVDAMLAIDAVPLVDWEEDKIVCATYMSVIIKSSSCQILLEDHFKTIPKQYILDFVNMDVFYASEWLGKPLSRLHLSTRELHLFEIGQSKDNKIPILYPTFTNGNCSTVLLTVEISDTMASMRDMNVTSIVHGLSLVYKVDSTWLFDLLEILTVEYPPTVSPIDMPSSTMDGIGLENCLCSSEFDLSLSEYRPVFTKVLVKCFDGRIDYSPTELDARLVLAFKKIIVSSNVVTGAIMQGFQFQFKDIGLYISNRTSDMDYDEISTRGRAFVNVQTENRGVSLQEKLEGDGFLTAGSLDTASAFLKCYTDIGTDDSPHLEAPPEISLEATLGLATLSTCFDSCETLCTLVGTWWDEYNFLQESTTAYDNGAYVGVVHKVARNAANDNREDSTTKTSIAVDLLDSVEENAFGRVDQVNGGLTGNPSDTEARIHRTLLTSPNGKSDFSNPSEISSPKMGKIIIEDYYTVDTGSSQNKCDPTSITGKPTHAAVETHAANWISPDNEDYDVHHAINASVSKFSSIVEQADNSPSTSPLAISQEDIHNLNLDAYDKEEPKLRNLVGEHDNSIELNDLGTTVNDFNAQSDVIDSISNSGSDSDVGDLRSFIVDDTEVQVDFSFSSKLKADEGSPIAYNETIDDSGSLFSDESQEIPMNIEATETSLERVKRGSTNSQTGEVGIELNDSTSAGWYDSSNDSTPLRIYPHHIEIPVSASAATLSFGEKEKSYAIRTAASSKSQDTDNDYRKLPRVLQHILIRDFSIRWRLFGGCDWDAPSDKSLQEKQAFVHHDNAEKQNTAVLSGTKVLQKKNSKDELLLNALLDNYVPESFDDTRAPGSFPTDSYMKGKQYSTRAACGTRKTEEMIEIVFFHIQARVDTFENPPYPIFHPLASSIVLNIQDFELLDYISTSHIRKMICYWKSDQVHPREAGTSMLRFHLMAVRPGMDLCEEHRLRCRILPLRINLDQETLEFLRRFFDHQVSENSSSHADADNLKNSPPSGRNPNSFDSREDSFVDVGAWFFQSCDIRSCKIKIDYRPQHVNYEALRDGDYLEMINLFVLEGMELSLRPIKLTGIDGWFALGDECLKSWITDISQHQIHKCVASVSMPPVRSISNVGSGAADLILLPLEQYGRDRRIVKGIKRGAHSFLKTMTIETLNTASKVARGTKSILEHADDVVSSDSIRRKRASRRAKRQSRKGNTHARYLTTQPVDAREGISQAYTSFSREMYTAANTIIAVPTIEYRKSGPQGYVKSVIRAVPVAVLRPMIGATDAISRALIGVRNQVDPEMKDDMENKFKDLTMLFSIGEIAINGLSNSYDTAYTDEMQVYFSEQAFSQAIDLVNEALIAHWPCLPCKGLGYGCCICTLGMSLYCALQTINEAEKAAQRQLERINAFEEFQHQRVSWNLVKSFFTRSSCIEIKVQQSANKL